MSGFIGRDDEEDKGSGLKYDPHGFIIGMKHMWNDVDKINDNVEAMRTILEQSLKAIQQAWADSRQAPVPPQPKLSAYQQFLQQANRQHVEYEDLVEEHAKAIQEATRKIQQATDQLNDTPPTARQEQDSDSKNKRAANGKANTPARRITPNSGVVDIGNIDDLRRNFSRPRDENGRFTGEQNPDRQDRDAKGRFTGNGTAGESTSVLSKFAKGFAVAARGLMPDTKGVDPTVDAINELGTLLSPVRKVAGFALRPLSGLFKSRKRNEPIPREQEQHNRRQIKLLQRIADHANSGGSLAPLARLLPMAMAAIAGIGGAIAAGFAAAAPVIAAALATAVTAYLSSKAGGAINEELGKTETGRKVQGTLGKLYARAKALFGDKEAQEAVAASDKAADAERYKDRPENPFWGSNDGVYRAMRIFGLEDWMKESAPSQAAGGSVKGNINNNSSTSAEDWKTGSISGLDEGITKRLVASTLATESRGGDINAINKQGYIGKYQAGASWLAQAGFIKGGSAAVKKAMKGYASEWDWAQSGGMTKFLKNDKNWVDGVNYSKYRKSSELQDQSFKVATSKNFEALKSKGLLNNKSPLEVAGLLKAAHIGGLGGAIAVAQGKSGKADINGTTPKDYYEDIVLGKDGLNNQPAVTPALKITPNSKPKVSSKAVTPATAKLADQSALQSVLNQQPAVAAVAKRSSTNANMVTAQSAPIKIESVKERLTSPDPKEVVVVNQSNDTINQNVSNRGLAHAFTGGLGMGKWDA